MEGQIIRRKQISMIIVALSVAVVGIAYGYQYGYQYNYSSETIELNDGATTYVPGVHIFTEMDYLRMDHEELTQAHLLLKSNLTKAVRLLLADAIEQYQPERFKVESIDRFAASYSVHYIDYDRVYKVFVDGEWETVSEGEYKTSVESYKGQQKQRIAGMQSILEALNETGE